MGLTNANYLSNLQDSLPPGPAWPRTVDAVLTKLLQGFADEFARVDGRALTILEEADPRTTTELLVDWERVAGLPDTCVIATQTTAQRRAALTTKLTSVGQQTEAYFIDLAARLGYTVTITENHTFTVKSFVNEPLQNAPWRFAFRVNSPLNTITRFTVNSSVSDPLAAWGNEQLECVINRFKPAHTKALYSYT